MTTTARAMPVLTVCPFCSCGCGLYAHDGRGDRGRGGVMPSERHPVARGRLCRRGWAAHEASLWGRRLTRPLVRVGEKLEAVSWDTALGVAAERLGAIRAAGGAVGVLGSGRATNEENFLAARLARAALRSPYVDAVLRDHTEALLVAAAEVRVSERAELERKPLRLAADGGTPYVRMFPNEGLETLERADVILLAEDDLARTHPRAAFAVLQALKGGARLVTIGVLRTQLAHLAWRHVMLLPGDVLKLPDDVRAAYRTAARPAVVLAPGGTAATAAALVRDFARFAAVVERGDHADALFLRFPVRANARGSLEMGVAPSRLPGLAPLDDPGAAVRVKGAWGIGADLGAGLDAEHMVQAVAGLVVLADDLPASLRCPAEARAALARLGALVVLDAFETETTRLAHVVLPIASPLETDGTFTSAEGRVQQIAPALPLAGEARPGWRALADLADAVGCSGAYDSLDDVHAEIGAVLPHYREAARRGGQVPLPPVATAPAAAPARQAGDAADAAFTFRLTQGAAFDFAEDPLFRCAPTLRREAASLRKRFPGGLVEMNEADAERAGVRAGATVKVTSAAGSASAAVALRRDVEPGVVLVPFLFREALGPATRGAAVTAARVERA